MPDILLLFWNRRFRIAAQAKDHVAARLQPAIGSVEPSAFPELLSKARKEPSIQHVATGGPHAERHEARQGEGQTDHLIDVPLVARGYRIERDKARKGPDEVQGRRHPYGRADNEILNRKRGKSRPAGLEHATDGKEIGRAHV